MSDPNHLALSERFRAFRSRAKLSQEGLGKHLGVSGNYVSMIELGKKMPGLTLRKLFESFEQPPQSPVEQVPAPASETRNESLPGALATVSATSVFCWLSNETLMRTFAEVAEKLSQPDPPKQKQVIENLRKLLDEIEQRLLRGSSHS